MLFRAIKKPFLQVEGKLKQNIGIYKKHETDSKRNVHGFLTAWHFGKHLSQAFESRGSALVKLKARTSRPKLEA
jgi:RecB family endonuclease NucS